MNNTNKRVLLATEQESRYDVMPVRTADHQQGAAHFCLTQTLNLAAAKTRQQPDLEKLEKMVSESRSWAVKSLKIRS